MHQSSEKLCASLTNRLDIRTTAITVTDATLFDLFVAVTCVLDVLAHAWHAGTRFTSIATLISAAVLSTSTVQSTNQHQSYQHQKLVHSTFTWELATHATHVIKPNTSLVLHSSVVRLKQLNVHIIILTLWNMPIFTTPSHLIPKMNFKWRALQAMRIMAKIYKFVSTLKTETYFENYI